MYWNVVPLAVDFVFSEKFGQRPAKARALQRYGRIVGAHAFGTQRADRAFANRVRREPRHVVTVEPELRKAGGDVRFSRMFELRR